MVVWVWTHAHTSIGSVHVSSVKVVTQSLCGPAIPKLFPYSITHPPLRIPVLSQQKGLECATWKLACTLRVNKPCALLGNAFLCARLCTTWTLQVLGHMSAQEVNKYVCLKCNLPEDVHLLCTSVQGLTL